MTAVEWLVKELNQKIDFIPMNKWNEIRDSVQQAISLEKQQILDAFDEGKSDGYKTAREWDEMVIFSNSEQYYNETYGSKGSDENFKQFSLYEHKETITSSDTKVSETFLDHVPDVRNMVSSQTEISDEEIEDRAAEWMEEDWDVKTYYEAFIDGASWYREQLKQRQ